MDTQWPQRNVRYLYLSRNAISVGNVEGSVTHETCARFLWRTRACDTFQHRPQNTKCRPHPDLLVDPVGYHPALVRIGPSPILYQPSLGRFSDLEQTSFGVPEKWFTTLTKNRVCHFWSFVENRVCHFLSLWSHQWLCHFLRYLSIGGL